MAAKKAAGASKAQDAGADDDPKCVEVLNPDDWPDALRMGVKCLNVKTVRRAREFAEVLPVCLSHNLRQHNGNHRHRGTIDKRRTPMNTVMYGSDRLDVAAELVRSVFDELGIKPDRRDRIAGIELVFQPPPGWDRPEFWGVCLELARRWFEHVTHAVIHRDQRRPHMHVLALALVDGRLSGDALTSGPNRYEARRSEFMHLMRNRFGLRPDRRVKTFEAIMTSTGRGAKTHAEAARRDAALGGKSLAHQVPSPPDPLAHQVPSPQVPSPDPHLRSVFLLHREGVERGLFASFAVGEIARAPRPALHQIGPETGEPAPHPGHPTAARHPGRSEGKSRRPARSPRGSRTPAIGSGERFKRPAMPEFRLSADRVEKLRALEGDEDMRVVMAFGFALVDAGRDAAMAAGVSFGPKLRERARYAARMAERALNRGMPVHWPTLVADLEGPACELIAPRSVQGSPKGFGVKPSRPDTSASVRTSV